MESLRKYKQLLSLLQKVEQSVERIINNTSQLESYNDYYCSPGGMERLESTCMLLIAIGEALKNIDKTTEHQLLPKHPKVDWKGAMGIRDIIAHHYFDLDAEVVFDVAKTHLPGLLEEIRLIIGELESGQIPL